MQMRNIYLGLLCIVGVSSGLNADSDFGAGFAGGLFGGTLASAASSRPHRSERVYVEHDNGKDAQVRELKEELAIKERKLNRREQEINELYERLNSYERRLNQLEKRADQPA